MANPSEDWRARALASFPELRDGLEDEGDIFSVYLLFGELLHLLKGAHRKGDDDIARYPVDQQRGRPRLHGAVGVAVVAGRS